MANLGKIFVYDYDTDTYLPIIIEGNPIVINALSQEDIKLRGETYIGGDVGNYTKIDLDGIQTMAGDGRVIKCKWLDVSGMRAPGVKPATYVDHGISGAWQFADGDVNTLVFTLKIPEDMDLTEAPYVLIGWSTATTVTTETAIWQLEYLYTAEGEDTTAVAQDTIEIESNAIAQANGLILASFTGLDLPDATDLCIHCRLERLGDDGDDDLTDTAELHGICFMYVANRLGTAV